MRRLLRRLRAGWQDETGVAQYVALALAVPLLLMAFVAGDVLVEAVSTQTALHNAAEIVDRSLVANGCLTTSQMTALDQTLTANRLNPNQVYLDTTGGSGQRAAYGQTGLSVVVGYDLNVPLPGTTWTIWHQYLQATVVNDQSQYVPNMANGGACVDATQVADAFSGTQGGQGSGGAGSGVTPVGTIPTRVTASASPTTVVAGQTVTVSGQVWAGSTPAAGASVTIAGGTSPATVQTSSQGTYQGVVTVKTPGTVTLTVDAGAASATVSVTVTPAQAATVNLTAPSPVTVNQPFTITGTVLDAAGHPVADGTVVTLSSNDARDMPNQSTTTTSGRFSFAVATGITQTQPNPVTVTVSAGSVSRSASITVDPGPVRSLSFHITPSSGAAGSRLTVSGQVLDANGNPVASGTLVTITSANDTRDALPQLTTDAQGDYSGTVTLTQAGSIQLAAQSGGVSSTPQSVSVTALGPAQAIGLSATPNPVNQGADTILTGTLVDQYGNPVASGTPVTLTSTAWTQPVTATTGAGGALSVPISFDTAGAQIVAVQYHGVTLLNGTVTITVNAQGAYRLTGTVAASPTVAGAAETVTFTLTDAQGHPVAGQALTLAESPQGAGTLSATSGTTNAQGQVAVTVTPTMAGVTTVTATLSTSNGTTTGTAVWSVIPAAPYAVTPPAISPSVAQSLATGGTVYPTLSGLVTDVYGNPIAGASVTATGGWASGSVAGRTDGQGQFALALAPKTIGGPYHPTLTVSTAQGTLTHTYAGTSLTVVPRLYTLTVTGLSGASTPAGTPYAVEATLTQQGAPLAGQTVTFTVSSGDGATSAWSTGTPTPGGPTAVTVTTNSQGQAVANVAFMPNTGTQTVQAAYAVDHTVGSLSVTVTANQPAAVYWDGEYQAKPFEWRQVTAGNTLVLFMQAVDAYGFGLSNGQTVDWAFARLSSTGTTQPWSGWPGYGYDTWFPSPTQAGTYYPVVTIDGSQFWGPSVTVNPAPMAYFYPVLGTANTDQWLPGYSWTNGSDFAQGPTNAYGTLGWPPVAGAEYAIAGIGYDQYGNRESWATATLGCSASTDGACPGLPGSASGGWQNIGRFISGSYTLTFTPASSSGGVSSTAAVTQATFAIPSGYWQTNGSGTVWPFGAAPNLGSITFALQKPIVGMAPTPDNRGYWLVGGDGGVFAFGDAGFYNSLPGIGVSVANIVGIAPTPDGGGYWLVGSDGGIYAFGDAGYYGSLPGDGVHVTNIVGMAPTPNGQGYWLVSSTGQVYAFGNATSYGNAAAGGIVGLAPTPDGGGYWLVSNTGQVSAFGNAPNWGSVAAGTVTNAAGLSPTPNNGGYRIWTTSGAVYTFGNAPDDGGQSTSGISGFAP